MHIRRPLLVVLIIGVVLSGALFSSSAQTAVDSRRLACGEANQPPDFFAEIRKAASIAADLYYTQDLARNFPFLFEDSLSESPYKFTQRFSIKQLRDFESSVQARIRDLEGLAQGPNRQCREAADPSSFDHYMLGEVLADDLKIELPSPLVQLYLARGIFRAGIAFKESGRSTEKAFAAMLEANLLAEAADFAGSLAATSTYELALSRTASSFVPIFLKLESEEANANISLVLLDPELWQSIACGEKSALDQ